LDSIWVTMQFSLLSAIVGFVAADVNLDTGKLTDFTSEFDVSLKDVPYGPEAAILMNGGMSGKLQLNLAAEKLKFSYETKDNWHLNANSPAGPPPGPFAMLIPGMSGASGEIVIDGPAGQATITEKAKVSAQGGGIAMDMNYCFHVKLPAGLVPPGGMLKRQADQNFPRIEQDLNHLPHTQNENGDLVYTPMANAGRDAYMAEHHYPTEDFSFTIKSDGSPVSALASSHCDAECMERDYMFVANSEVSLNVNSFTAGAGDVTPTQCVDSAAADLSEHPGIMHATVVFDTVMAQMAKNSGLKLPSLQLQPVIAQQMLLAENVNQGSQQQPWTVALLAGVAGMTGGAVVLALDKVFRRQGRNPPLLSEA